MILYRLRERTRPYHERLEQKLNLLDSARTLKQYTQLLHRFYCFYLFFEGGLSPLVEDLPGLCWSLRRKTPRIERDLRALGASQAQLLQVSRRADLPVPATLSQAFGSLYVLEGATLGGQIIGRHLKAHLGLAADNGASFFLTYGSEVGPMWRAFGTLLTAFAEANPHEQETILNAACRTFAAFEAWCCEGEIGE